MNICNKDIQAISDLLVVLDNSGKFISDDEKQAIDRVRNVITGLEEKRIKNNAYAWEKISAKRKINPNYGRVKTK